VGRWHVHWRVTGVTMTTLSSIGIWGGEVRVWVGAGGSPVGVRTMATTASLPFSYVDKGGGRGGVLWAIRGEWGRWGRLTV
jgi:hypothetical protein